MQDLKNRWQNFLGQVSPYLEKLVVAPLFRALAPDDAASSRLSGPGWVTGVPALTPHRGSRALVLVG